MKRFILLFFCLNVALVNAHKKALIFGITGQDGFYLTELLLQKDYEVHGVIRPHSINNKCRSLEQFQTRSLNHLILHHGDITDSCNVQALICSINPDEIYNLAAQSNVKISFDAAFATASINALGALNILETIRLHNKKIKFFQASSSEMFGKTMGALQHEDTPFSPQSPYGIAKLYAHWITRNYRSAFGIFACSGILFNHESPLRNDAFVSRKITQAVIRIAAGEQDILYLGNIHARRDWGYAKDYVEAMWLMLQQDTPDDYVIATGKSYTVKEFVEKAFAAVDINIEWQGEGLNQKGINIKTQKIVVAIDPAFFRPNDIEYSVGDATKAQQQLNWYPQTNFDQLIQLMINYEKENFQ